MFADPQLARRTPNGSANALHGLVTTKVEKNRHM